MTKAQFKSREADLIAKLNPVVEILTALDEGRGTSAWIAAWNELHETERVLREELFDLRNNFAFAQSTGIIGIII